MHQQGRRRSGAAAEIVLLHQHDPQAPASGVASDRCSVETTTNNCEVEIRHAVPHPVMGTLVEKQAYCLAALPDPADRTIRFEFSAADPSGIVLNRLGFAQEIALHLIAGRIGQKAELILGFDAFREN